MIDAITVLRAAEHGLPAAESHPDPPYVCFPMPSEWRAMQPVAVEPYPAPVATVLDGHAVPAIPGPVATLKASVEREGWVTLVQHSHGWNPHASYGTPGAKSVDVWAVRMRRGDRSAVAVRTGAMWEFFYVWAVDSIFRRVTTVTHFRDVLAFGPWLGDVFGPDDLSWLGKFHGPWPSESEARWGSACSAPGASSASA